MEFDTVICFETHVELRTQTKLFCNCRVDFDAPPNTHICSVCTGQPGALPVLNKKAMEYTLKAGLALNCTINKRSQFARKNYTYPDLPKGYQISQYDLPFCENGYLDIEGDDGEPYMVGIRRIHLEEDAGKLVHSSDSLKSSTHSLVDFNRASVPLIEIVTDHMRNPLRSLNEAKAYLEKLKQVLQYIEISECLIEKGQFRCDVNISLRPKGSKEFGNRAEIKNLGSFKFILEALKYEMKRQTGILQSGSTVIQETRLFDEKTRKTYPMRSKEDVPDYRYFPDPDLVFIELDQEFIDNIAKTMPELASHRVSIIIEKYGILKSEAQLITREKAISDFFEECATFAINKKRLSQWLINDLFGLINTTHSSIQDIKFLPKDFAQLVNLIENKTINDQIARKVLKEMISTGKSPDVIIEKNGLKQISDSEALDEVLEEVIKKHPDVVQQIQSGKSQLINFLIGQTMKITKGQANAKKLDQLLRQKLLD